MSESNLDKAAKQQAQQICTQEKDIKSTSKDKKEKNKPGVLKKSSSTASNWGIGTWLTKKMYPEAKVADIGDEMQAYFDEKLGVWVFPGEEDKAAEVAAGPPPPPTNLGPVSMDGSEGMGPGNATSSAQPDDPLAALMAPPPSSLRGFGGAASTRFTYPNPYAPTPPANQNGTPPVSQTTSQAIPKYAVFAPPR